MGRSLYRIASPILYRLSILSKFISQEPWQKNVIMNPFVEAPYCGVCQIAERDSVGSLTKIMTPDS
jgi:hypothetical protein